MRATFSNLQYFDVMIGVKFGLADRRGQLKRRAQCFGIIGPICVEHHNPIIGQRGNAIAKQAIATAFNICTSQLINRAGEGKAARDDAGNGLVGAFVVIAVLQISPPASSSRRHHRVAPYCGMCCCAKARRCG
jgi:hypothetical protein